MAAGAVGALSTPDGLFDAVGAVELEFTFLPEMLGRRRIEPVRERVTAGCTGAWLLGALRAVFGRSTAILFCTAGRLFPPLPAPRMVPWPVGDGNWVSLKSVEADSRLLCRSSKLTEGRNSNEEAVSVRSSGKPFLAPPKEKREWLLEDEALSIGASWAGRRTGPNLVGLVLRDLLNWRDRKARLATSPLTHWQARSPARLLAVAQRRGSEAEAKPKTPTTPTQTEGLP